MQLFTEIVPGMTSYSCKAWNQTSRLTKKMLETCHNGSTTTAHRIERKTNFVSFFTSMYLVPNMRLGFSKMPHQYHDFEMFNQDDDFGGFSFSPFLASLFKRFVQKTC